MSYAAKGYNKILLMRLRNGLESKLRYNQNGFRPDRSTQQHVLAIRSLFEVAKTKKNFKFVCTFIDFCKAFDSVEWNYIKAILIAYNVPVLLVNAIMAQYNGASAEVVTSDGTSDEIKLSVGMATHRTISRFMHWSVTPHSPARGGSTSATATDLEGDGVSGHHHTDLPP